MAMHLLQRGAAMLQRNGKASYSSTVTYRRGGATVDVPAVIGQTPIGVALDGAVTQSWQTTDFLIAADDLLLGGQATKPEIGDVIELEVRNETLTFVVSEAEDNRCFRYSDATREMLRVHTREQG